MIDFSDAIGADLKNNTVKITNYDTQSNVDGVLTSGGETVHNSVPVVALTLSATRASDLNVDSVTSFEITITSGQQCYHARQLPGGSRPASTVEMDDNLKYRVVKAENYPQENLCIAVLELIR
jgi:hypothetical protein